MNTYSITDLRQKTLDIVRSALNHGYVQIIHNSKPKVAVVDTEYLNALQAAYEDLLDIQEIAQTRHLKRIPLKKHLQKHPLK